jgi:hypothetical protein
MKKKFLLFILLLEGVAFSNVYAGQQQEIPMQIINTGALGGGHTYAPPRPWYITQDEYTLTLPAFEDDYILELRDEDDEVVYTTFLPSGTTQVILPSTLSGSFEIRLVGDTYYYRGYLEL